MTGTAEASTTEVVDVLQIIEASINYANDIPQTESMLMLSADRIRNGVIEATVWDTDDEGEDVESAKVRITVEVIA